jgi:hypothetical protein
MLLEYCAHASAYVFVVEDAGYQQSHCWQVVINTEVVHTCAWSFWLAKTAHQSVSVVVPTCSVMC